MKKVLVVGSGGREHALVWQLKRSPQVKKVFCAPGNAGIAADAECVNIKVDQLEKLADFAVKEKIDLTVVGPEAPLCDGIVDVFRARGLKIFGPDKVAAQLEGSKDFAKKFMVKYGIPTAASETFEDPQAACDYIDAQFDAGAKGIVVKADGLAAGKGVLVAENRTGAKDFVKECFEGAFGAAGTKVVIEEMLLGEEASVLALTDGKSIIQMVSSQDHKRIFDDDRGPNTGGMGAYSPAPVVTKEVESLIETTILAPFLKGINEEKLNFRGVIFCGIMIYEGVPKVLEFNVRFGDPEIQPVMRRFVGDWYDVLEKTVDGRLDEAELNWSKECAISVVMASGGYPGSYEKGKEITGLDRASAVGAVVFHCGTAQKGDKIVTDGGRVLGVSAVGSNIVQAIRSAYYGVQQISFDGMFFRRDIARKALRRPYMPMKKKNGWLALAILALLCLVWIQPWFNEACSTKFIIAKAVISIYLVVRCLLLLLKNKFSLRICLGTFAILAIMAMMVSMFSARDRKMAQAAGNKPAVESAQPAAR
ncbi:MAG: phosphoribosylamine--glycine ligase [Lentisphaeria bacterium]|nr:phosphoribosylamine--glycine ligase [Lentisphaeria bacterium]